MCAGLQPRLKAAIIPGSILTTHTILNYDGCPALTMTSMPRIHRWLRILSSIQGRRTLIIGQVMKLDLVGLW